VAAAVPQRIGEEKSLAGRYVPGLCGWHGASLSAFAGPGDAGDESQRVFVRQGVGVQSVERGAVRPDVFFPIQIETTHQMVENNNVKISNARK
jgi:hypothetical protein